MALVVTQAPYNCDPTGLSDATSGLQSAFNAASSGGPKAGQRVEIPAGTYLVTGQGLVCRSGLHVRGEGPGTVLKHVSPTMSYGTLQTPGDGTLSAGLLFEHLTLDGGQGDPTAASYGFVTAVGGAKEVEFVRCKFSGYQAGGIRNTALLDSSKIIRCEFVNINTSVLTLNSSGSAISGRLQSSVIAHCYFHDCGTPTNNNGTSWCVYLNGFAANNTVTSNVFRDCVAGITTASSSDPKQNSYGHTIVGNTFTRMLLQSVRVLVTQGLVVSKNTVQSTTAGGSIDVGNDVAGYVLEGNTITNIGATSQAAGFIFTASNSQGRVSGNTVSFPDNVIFGAGFTLFAASGLTLEGNVTTGLCYGVHVFSTTGTSNVQGLSILNNSFDVPPGAVQINPGGAYVRRPGPPGGMATFGVLLNGTCDLIDIRGNRVSGMDCELGFAKASGGTGTPTRVSFQSPDSNRPLTSGIVTYAPATLPPDMTVLAQVVSHQVPYQFTVPLGVGAPLPGTQGASLMDADLVVRFNNNRRSLAFVQGEDRTIGILVTDANTGEPLDLTSATVTLSFPREGGGTVRRTSGPVRILASQVSVGTPPVLSLLNHGLVTGDPVTLSANASGTLPTGLSAQVSYLVQSSSPNLFGLTDTDGNPITVTTQGTGSFNLLNANDVQVDVPTLGHAVLNLRALVSAAVQDGLAQNFQVSVLAANKLRIAILGNDLDVFAQTG